MKKHSKLYPAKPLNKWEPTYMSVFKVVKSENGEFMCIANMWTIGYLFRLHREAEQRILRETVNGGVCRLHLTTQKVGEIDVTLYTGEV